MQGASAEEILELAAGRFDRAEVFDQTGESVSVSFEDNRLKEIKTRQYRGLGLRVVDGGRIGFTASTDLRDPTKLVEMAAASAAFGDEARFELPGQPETVPDVGTYDEAVPDVSADQMVQMGRQGLEASRDAHDDYLYSCGLSRSANTRRLLNTRGLDASYASTGMSGYVGVQLFGDSGLLQVYERKSWGKPFASVMDLTGTVLDKMEKAGTVAPTGLEEVPIIFHPKAFGTLMGPLRVALNGKNVHKGSSVLRGRLNEQVLDPRITITDDPAIDFAPGSCPFDDEGIPCGRRHFFEEGVLRSYTIDLQTAGLLGMEPTGHGSRSWSSRPSPSPTNVLMARGDVPYEQMLEGLERGVVVEQTLGSGQSNTLAGEFSVNVALGFLVEDGRIAGRVKDCMVAGNVYEVLGEVEAVGSEPQWQGSLRVPPVLVTGLKLAAQG